MRALTHLLFALLCFLLIQHYFSFSSPVVFLIVVLLSSLLVDLDTVDSTAGRRLWPVSLVVAFFLHHRGLLHSFWIPLLFYIFVKDVSFVAAAGFFVGYVSHLLLDALTVQGVAFFYPLRYRWRGFFVTGGFLEKCLQLLLVIGVLVLLLVW